MAEEESSRRAAQDSAHSGLREPKSLLYSINARTGGYGVNESRLLADDCGFLAFHGWAGNSARSPWVAKKRCIPSVLEISTRHRDKGKPHNSPKRILESGRAARNRAETELTWDNFRDQAYDLALRGSR